MRKKNTSFGDFVLILLFSFLNSLMKKKKSVYFLVFRFRMPYLGEFT